MGKKRWKLIYNSRMKEYGQNEYSPACNDYIYTNIKSGQVLHRDAYWRLPYDERRSDLWNEDTNVHWIEEHDPNVIIVKTLQLYSMGSNGRTGNWCRLKDEEGIIYPGNGNTLDDLISDNGEKAGAGLRFYGEWEWTKHGKNINIKPINIYDYSRHETTHYAMAVT